MLIVYIGTLTLVSKTEVVLLLMITSMTENGDRAILCGLLLRQDESI